MVHPELSGFDSHHQRARPPVRTLLKLRIIPSIFPLTTIPYGLSTVALIQIKDLVAMHEFLVRSTDAQDAVVCKKKRA